MNNLTSLYLFSLLKESFIYGLSGFIIAILVTPLYFLKTQRQSTGNSYKEIYSSIKNHDKFYKILFSGVFYIAILNAYASFIFGVIEGLSIPLIKNIFLMNSYGFLAIIMRTIFLGASETLINAYFDYKAILKEKSVNIDDMHLRKTNFFHFSILAFLKNTIGWSSTTLSIFIIYILKNNFQIELSYFQSFILSFAVSFFMSSIILPFDVMCVQAVAIKNDENIMQIIKNNIKENGLKRLCYGGIMRIIIMSCFASGTVLVDLYLKYGMN